MASVSKMTKQFELNKNKALFQSQCELKSFYVIFLFNYAWNNDFILSFRHARVNKKRVLKPGHPKYYINSISNFVLIFAMLEVTPRPFSHRTQSLDYFFTEFDKTL